MSNLYKIVIWASLAVSICGLVLPFAPQLPRAGGITNYDSLALRSEVAGDNALLIQSSAGTNKVVVSGVGSTTVSGKFALASDACATASWDPIVMSSSSAPTTTISMAGAALGDIILSSFDSATSSDQWFSKARVSTSGIITAFLVPTASSTSFISGLNLSTSTLRVCQIK